jgi:hypothetical protein
MNSRSRSHVQLDVKAPVLVVPIAMTTANSSTSATSGAYSELLVIDLGRLQLATVALADMKLDANDVVSKAQQLASPKAVAVAATTAVADVDAATAETATVSLANGECMYCNYIDYIDVHAAISYKAASILHAAYHSMLSQQSHVSH